MISIGWRNPIEFIEQWKFNKYKWLKMFIWIFYCWKRNDLDVWIDYGFRILGVEISYKKFIHNKG